MTDIEDYYYNGSFKYDAIGKWTGYFCELYVLPSMVYIVSDESHHLRFNSYTLEQCNTQKKLKTIIDHLDDTDDYADIVQLINILENKENEAAEIGAIVNGRVPLAANELFFSIRITVRGSKPAAFVLGMLTLAIFIVGIKAGMAWIKNTNPVDNILFALLTIIPLILAAVFTYVTYKLFIKVKAVNNTLNFGIWLTKKYLVCYDGNAGLTYVPVPFIDHFSIYKSNRPPLQMVIVAVKKPYAPLRLVTNWLTTPQTPEQLKETLELQLNILNLPPSLITKTDAVIRYANGYPDDQKMFHLITGCKDIMNENRQSKKEWDQLAIYIDQKIISWPDAIKIIPEDWVFAIEVNENWEYGVNGVSYSEKGNGVNEKGHWLMPAGRVLVVQNQLLENYFIGSEMNQLATLLSTSAIQKMIFKITLPKYAPGKIKESLDNYENLKKVVLVFEKAFTL